MAKGLAYLTAVPAVRVLVSQRKNSKHRHASSSAQEALLKRWLEVVTLIGVYGGLLMPLVYARIVIFPFVYLKMLYFQILIGFAFTAWATLALRDARYRPKSSWLMWGLFAWFAAMGLSTAFAANPWRAFFGTQERMTGLFSLLHFFAWFVMAVSTLRSSRDWRRLLELQVGVGAVSGGVSILQLAIPDVMGSLEAGEGARLSGLLGNPIYVGAYQTFCVFFIVFLWPDASRFRRSLYALALLPSLSAFLLAGSRGPLLGLVTGLGVAALAFAAVTGRRKFTLAATASGALAVVAYAVVVGLLRHRPTLDAFWASHANIAHFFDFQLDACRIQLWTAAWDGFVNRPILGWGPAGYELAYGAMYRPSYHAMGMNDEAHNHFLGVMCETGLLGLVAFLFMWVTYFLSVFRSLRNGRLAPLEGAALVGAGFGHLVQCVFAFDTPATQLTTFLAFAVATAAATRNKEEPTAVEDGAHPEPARWLPVGTAPAVMVAVVAFGSVIPGMASVYAKQASSALAQHHRDEMLSWLTRSQRLATPYHDDQLLVAVRALLQLAKSKELDEWDQRKDALTVTHSIAEQYFSKNKAHARLRRVYANMLLVIGRTYVSAKVLGRAEALFKQDLADSPRRQAYLLDYAKFQEETGHLAEAEFWLRKAVALDPSIGEPRWELGKFTWHFLKRAEEGARLMADAGVNMATLGATTNDYVPMGVTEWQQFAQACARVGQLEKLRAIVRGVRTIEKREYRSFEPQLGIAGNMEKSGLLAERDEVLTLTLERNPKLASFINPVISGKTTLAAQQTAAEANKKPAPGPLADAGKRLTQDAPISLARMP